MTINLILQSATKSVNPPVKAFSLGDGYEQTHSTAIADTEIWTVSTIPLDDDDANDLEAALNALQGDTFTWIPPYGNSGDYRLNSRITRTMVGYRRSVLQFSLRKVPLPPISATSSFYMDFDGVPNGAYPFQVYAPDAIQFYPNNQVKIYITAARVNDYATIGTWDSRDYGLSVGVWWYGDVLIGTGKQITATNYQVSGGISGFDAFLRWEANT